jgi:PAS domain S-box-containing protein
MTSARQKAATPKQRTYDRIPLGVVRVNSQRKVTYANRAMRALIGADLVGTRLMSFVESSEDRDRLEKEFRKRIRGGASQYEIELTRPADGRHVPVSISAAPEFDAGGTPAGSLAFVRDLSIERANSEIHRAIERETTMEGLLGAFCREIGKLIPFDGFRVTLVSKSRKHLVALYEQPERFIREIAIKWWPMPPMALEYLKCTEVHDLDVEEWFSQPEARALARSDPNTQKWLREGFKHVLVRPVLRESRVVAFVAMETRNPKPYSAEQLHLCEQIPVSEVVLSVLQIEKQRELEFTVALIREMGDVSDNVAEVARVLVQRVQEHYGWEHVSLFQADDNAGVLRLMKQAGAEGVLLPGDYTQKLDVGLIGLAYNGGSGRAVNVGDVLDSKYRETYVIGIGKTRSEMCLPVPGRKLRWILNVEATKQNAFADEEQERVQVLLREAGFILERAALRGLKLAIMDSIKDAVLQTSDAGRIMEMNVAAAELFGAEPGQLVGRNFDELVELENARDAVAAAASSPRTEVTLKRANGKSFPALLSCARLPAELGGKVFVASDLSYQKRVEQTEQLKDVFWQVAQETRTPLALVSSWLRRAAQGREGELAEILDKSLRQLRKMDVTLERVLRVASDVRESHSALTAIDLRKLVDGLLEELPHADAARVDRAFDERLPAVMASRQDLEFCVNNLFGVMMRSGAQEEKLVVAAHREAGSVVLELHNVTQDSARRARTRPAHGKSHGPLHAEIACGLEAVKSTLQRMGADLETGGAGQDGFAIHLPLAEKAGEPT